MLPLSDPRWARLKAGYGIRHQVPNLLMRLERGEDVWDSLWEELHHQGTVGEASYAAVPHLVRIAATAGRRDWNLYGLVSVIEVERQSKNNPRVPDWLRADYRAAMQHLLHLGLLDLATTSDEETVRTILAAVALAKGAAKLGAWLTLADESVIEEDLAEKYGWLADYSPDPIDA